MGSSPTLNDLHKGRDTGGPWSILIDAAAVLLSLISLSGLVLIFYLKLRRKPGLWVAGLAALALLALVLFGVPGVLR